jgi:hypothetical protein
MSYDNLSSVSQNVLKFYLQLTGEERRIPVKNERDPPLFTADKILKHSKPCNQKQELDVVAMFVNESGRNEHS